MSSIHYFQRYTQAENVATNNTLLLFSRLYQHSPNKFKGLLNDLLEDTDLQAGVFFNQQEKGVGSIPDGIINQTSFKVVIETKMHQNFSVSQLIEHLKSFGKEEHQILLSLSPRQPDKNLQNQIHNEITNFNSTNKTSIKYIPTTFQQIVEKYNDVIENFETELVEIIDDFEDYCLISGLITDIEYRMRVVTCGWTLKENFEYNLYYDPADRGYSEHKYLGIYSDKCVRGIGKVENIITADLINGKLNIINSTSQVTTQQEKDIIAIIPLAMKNNGFEISTGHKFFCVEKFYETSFTKITKYPLQGTKFFNLKTELSLDTLPSTIEIAKLLEQKTW
jgi:hypothetical protein